MTEATEWDPEQATSRSGATTWSCTTSRTDDPESPGGQKVQEELWLQGTRVCAGVAAMREQLQAKHAAAVRECDMLVSEVEKRDAEVKFLTEECRTLENRHCIEKREARAERDALSNLVVQLQRRNMELASEAVERK